MRARTKEAVLLLLKLLPTDELDINEDGGKPLQHMLGFAFTHLYLQHPELDTQGVEIRDIVLKQPNLEVHHLSGGHYQHSTPFEYLSHFKTECCVRYFLTQTGFSTQLSYKFWSRQLSRYLGPYWRKLVFSVLMVAERYSKLPGGHTLPEEVWDIIFGHWAGTVPGYSWDTEFNDGIPRCTHRWSNWIDISL
jgi:hypothetical protein